MALINLKFDWALSFLNRASSGKFHPSIFGYSI